MDKSEVMEAVLVWVLGMCYKHNEETKTFAVFRTAYDSISPAAPTSEAAQCIFWVRDCQEKVWRYVNDRQTMLDSSYSDFQCVIATQANHLFGVHLK